MSFSSDVKEELSFQKSPARHCRIAELAALIGMCGDICISAANRLSLRIHTENTAVARKCFFLLQDTFSVMAETAVRLQKKDKKGNRIFTIYVRAHEDTIRILQAVKLLDTYGEISEQISPANQLLIQHSCCRRAFIRGAFLAGGAISNPEKSYHFEIACNSMERALQLQQLIHPFGPDAKIVLRKKYYIVYVKEGAQIVDMLNIMEAHNALMDLENIRILREMRNSVNRKVNCEAANINKTVNASVRQIEDIRCLQSIRGLNQLPDPLKEMAWIRLEHPDASLKELGEFFDPPLGKSGVNHRLKKLSALAEELRNEK